jgi:sulfite exporter TauE/SafE
MKSIEAIRVDQNDLSDTRPPRSILRSIGAVVAGFVVVFVLSLGTDVIMHATGIYPPWFQPMSDSLFVLATAYRLVYGVIGGYVTARLAPASPMKHALVLGAIGTLMATIGAIGTWNAGPELGPKWYLIVLIVTAIPCSWLGGKLRLMQLR